MQHDAEALLEHVLNAVMQPETDALSLAIHMRNTLPDVRPMALLRALLSAEAVIRDTFNGNSQGRTDGALALQIALTLAELADDQEAGREADHEAGRADDATLRLRDLPL